MITLAVPTREEILALHETFMKAETTDDVMSSFRAFTESLSALNPNPNILDATDATKAQIKSMLDKPAYFKKLVGNIKAQTIEVNDEVFSIALLKEAITGNPNIHKLVRFKGYIKVIVSYKDFLRV